MKDKCSICGEEFDLSELYEYRGQIACHPHFKEMEEKREAQRQEIIVESKAKTDKFKGLDMGGSSIGKANREILKDVIEVAKKEGQRRKEYEG